MMYRFVLLFVLAVGGTAAPRMLHALTCSASMSDVSFGSISVRSGISNTTTGTLTVSCSDTLLSVVGVCVTFGAGSGGAGGGNSPRYMRRADNAALSYELRPNGPGAINGTWNSAFFLVPVALGSGMAVVNVHGAITSTGIDVGTGFYSSDFDGATGGSLRYGVSSCSDGGATVAIPQFTVSADVQSSCEVDGATLDFGNVPFTVSAPIDKETLLTVRCTASTNYSIRLGLGEGPGVTLPENRKMTFATATLTYGLYRDSARSAPWGNTAGQDVQAIGSGLDQTFTVFGRVHSGQSLLPGIYSDAVVVTIEY